MRRRRRWWRRLWFTTREPRAARRGRYFVCSRFLPKEDAPFSERGGGGGSVYCIRTRKAAVTNPSWSTTVFYTMYICCMFQQTIRHYYAARTRCAALYTHRVFANRFMNDKELRLKELHRSLEWLVEWLNISDMWQMQRGSRGGGGLLGGGFSKIFNTRLIYDTLFMRLFD